MSALDELVQEAQRQFDVCNACRYCEGYCAVFPALERRTQLVDADVMFLANVCHDCKACYQACMYTAPHEFALDIPTLLEEVRTTSYRSFAWPTRLAGAFDRPFVTQTAALAVGLASTVALTALSGAHWSASTFYEVIPSRTTSALFLLLTALAASVLVASFVRFWRVVRPTSVSGGAALRALWDAATLRLLGGGGAGCFYPNDEAPSMRRRRFHLLLVVGLALAFAATVAAAIEQHLLGVPPPYPALSAPVVLGVLGGAAALAGGAGLAVLKSAASRRGEQNARSLDYAFLLTLELVIVTGFLLLVVRDSTAMPLALIVHEGAVVALFLALPFGKLVHASHRIAALLVDSRERELEHEEGS
jgi:citrate/tricarballylate utilization protein